MRDGHWCFWFVFLIWYEFRFGFFCKSKERKTGFESTSVGLFAKKKIPSAQPNEMRVYMAKHRAANGVLLGFKGMGFVLQRTDVCCE